MVDGIYILKSDPGRDDFDGELAHIPGVQPRHPIIVCKPFDGYKAELPTNTYVGHSAASVFCWLLVEMDIVFAQRQGMG